VEITLANDDDMVETFAEYKMLLNP